VGLPGSADPYKFLLILWKLLFITTNDLIDAIQNLNDDPSDFDDWIRP